MEWETKFHSHTKREGKTVLYILIHAFLDSRWEDMNGRKL
jgi:hypothetical protein